MSKRPIDTVAAMMAADAIIWRVEPSVCDQCETVCWSLEGRAQGDLGPEVWETPIAWADHLTLGSALVVLIRTVGSQASRVKARECEAWTLEHQPMLW